MKEIQRHIDLAQRGIENHDYSVAIVNLRAAIELLTELKELSREA